MTEAIRYRTPGAHSQVHHGILVKETKSRLYVILIESGMHMRKVPRGEEKFIDVLPGHKIKTVKRQLRQFAKSHKIKLSKEVREALMA